MKRQGTYGFTFKDKNDEWWHWTVSCQAIVRAEAIKRLDHLFGMQCAYVAAIWDEPVTEARHSPAQPQNAPEIGVGSGRPVLTPVGRLNLVLIATSLGMAIALWKGWL